MIIIHQKPISRIRRILNRISRFDPIRLYYRYKHIIFTPSNKLHIRNIPKSWADRSERMFHAPFSILCEYVEKEGGGIDNFDLENGETGDQEIVDLYTWYNSINWKCHSTDTKEYTEMMKSRIMSVMENGEIHTMCPGYSPADEARIILENMSAEKDFEELCTQQAIRLMKIRNYLWT